MKSLIVLALLAAFCLADHTPTHDCTQAGGDIHRQLGSRQYHFSWLSRPGQIFNWGGARRYCQSICMEMVSLEEAAQWRMVQETFKTPSAPRFIWTAGRKCNYRGCDIPRLQPAIENGWFWATSTKPSIPNPFSGQCAFCEWGPTGALNKRQPDNRQYVREGKDEACLAILNNLYKDGLKWHDVACHHRKPVICQRAL